MDRDIGEISEQLEDLAVRRTELALKNALLEIISCMLSPNSDLRGLAEERKKALEVTEEYALHLMEILLTAEEALEERQMAGTLLRQYVRNHWSEVGDEFVPPLTPDHVKERVRTILPIGLTDSSGKIRNNIVMILVSIVEADFPQQWPAMLENLFLKLQTGDVNTCMGILEFIKELNRTAGYYHIIVYADLIYPVLYNVAQDVRKYNTKIRGDAIYLFANTGSLHCADDPKRDKLASIFNNFLNMCGTLLLLPHPEQSDYFLKASVMRACTLLLTKVKGRLTPTMVNMLPIVWQILSRCGQMYDQMIINESEPNRDPSENSEESPRFYMLVYNIFDMLRAVLDVEQSRSQILAVLPDLIYYIILFMGLSKETEEVWKNDSDAYFADDSNDESSNTSVRIKGKELLVYITKVLSADNLLNAVSAAVDKHTNLSKLKNESYYWRIMEAVMYAMGTIRSFVINLHQNEQLQNFDIVAYLCAWIGDMVPGRSAFMTARILWVGARYAIILDEDVLCSYVMATIHNLRDPSFILRFTAIRSICLHLTTINNSRYRAIYLEQRHRIAHALIYGIDHSQGYVLHVGLHALELLLNIEPRYIETIQNEVLALITNLLLRNISHPDIITDCQAVVKVLSANRNCHENLLNKLLPIITSCITQVVAGDQPSASFETQCTAIELLNVIVKYAPEPLVDNLIRYGFTAVYTCIISVDDCSITQCGADCLRTYICKGSSQMITFTDSEGRTGTDYILNVLKYVLDPHKMEFACKQVGRFFITAMHTLGPHLNQHVDFLLRGVLSSMQRASTISVEENLLIIFAYLFYYHLQDVLNYLTLIPGPEGQSALAFILDKWLSKNYYYGGKYQRNLNILALTRLMEHTIIQQDQRVATIKIKDVPILEKHLPVRPFSPTSKHSEGEHFCVEVPVLLKVLKHLVYVLENETEYDIAKARYETASLSSSKTSVSGSTSDKGDARPSSPIIQFPKKPKVIVGSSSEDTDSDCCDIIHATPDPLDTTDPIYNMNIREFLTNFFKNLAENTCFTECVSFLDGNQKKVLASIGLFPTEPSQAEGLNF